MKNKFYRALLCALALLFMLCLCSCDVCGGIMPQSVTVKAEVERVSGTKLFVRGLTGGFCSDYVLDTVGAEVCFEDGEHVSEKIEPGDIISITFSGISLKEKPGTLMGVSRVVKLKAE